MSLDWYYIAMQAYDLVKNHSLQIQLAYKDSKWCVMRDYKIGMVETVDLNIVGTQAGGILSIGRKNARLLLTEVYHD